MVGVDIKNSQPFFASMFLQEYNGLDFTRQSSLDLGIMAGTAKEGAELSWIVDEKKFNKAGDDLMAYLNHVECGTFYESLVDNQIAKGKPIKVRKRER